MRERYCTNITKSLTAVLATTPEITISGYAAGAIFIPTGITSLTYYAAYGTGGTYVPIYDQDGTAITQTVVADRAYAMPSDVFGAGQIKIVADASGDVQISLKT